MSTRCASITNVRSTRYVSDPFRAIDWQLQGMTQTGDKVYGTAEEWTLLINRVRSIPRYLGHGAGAARDRD